MLWGAMVELTCSDMVCFGDRRFTCSDMVCFGVDSHVVI